jgi:hypothetical protein
MESDREKASKTNSDVSTLLLHLNSNYGYIYPYLCFSKYGYKIIWIPLPYFHQAWGTAGRGCCGRGARLGDRRQRRRWRRSRMMSPHSSLAPNGKVLRFLHHLVQDLLVAEASTPFLCPVFASAVEAVRCGAEADLEEAMAMGEGGVGVRLGRVWRRWRW